MVFENNLAAYTGIRLEILIHFLQSTTLKFYEKIKTKMEEKIK